MYESNRGVGAGALAVMLGLVACVDREPDSSHRFTIETADGIEVASNRGGPRFTEPLFTLEEELRLQQDPDNVESLLYQPNDFVRGSDGNYYVADSGNGRIAVFDAGGEFVRGIGRPGQGPGEFDGTLRIPLPVDQRLQVFDSERQRTQSFDLHGNLLDTISLPFEGGVESLAREPDGTLVFSETVTATEGSMWFHAAALGVIPAGASRPLARVQTASVPGFIVSEVRTEEFVAMTLLQIPFSGDPAAFRIADGVLLVDGATGSLEWRDADGTLRRRATIEREAIPITESMRQAALDNHRRARERDAEEGRTVVAQIPEPWFPEVAGWWRAAHLDDAGFLWLQDAVQSTLRPDEASVRYEIVSPAGQYLGHVFLPVTDFRVQNGTILAHDEDPRTDEARLRVFRLRVNAPGFDYPGA